MTWLKAKISALLRWVGDTFAYGWNYVVDPPPRHLKFYFWLVLAGSLAGYFLWAPIFNGVKSFVAPMYQAAKPLPLISPTDITTTVPPPIAAPAPTLPPLAKVITAATIAPAKAVPGATKKVVRKKRKAKCQTVFC